MVIPIWIFLSGACSEEPSDLFRDWVKVNVIETGSGRQARHGAHLRKEKNSTTQAAVKELCM